ncbi:cysteine--tRNA ligase [Candidatus Gottesmanbacteria bacterium CG11_big_fil_rev_8_21_14_0_20_37_11]|uniref:Cysteine--tRNA ligase n=3 Tax=Candidatus Gottesmaniibacteriota TaxID=1752720 RepID=A0A2M7RQS7_9BACT|nr:MAG: cysteine--tRNA ligase [Candidatus Gottesmanbacteria bacterium CG1_02_37_22]PIP33101.1 MAG: cysteine--tRNA ligase [Candidatus Gottesmanbacteria bacterium CG23_combo_of_CG06-09_8_20_14_all_37_19]PIR08955.1 MAG: cysteine--tRNA ligase [Candidatus Gottesmanbacteria bacterium CG11_big_fil_rev_8_21_14_0_20_37_11]PIZ02658.1 MAG: cysteine--tRNA ligase [Candidatus Gottesmanbacteria bacterium CG_4_10_14_0_8_um_filter_37_24]
MRLYNTFTRKLEEFKPINQNKIGIYSCGPTVYWNQHIGHMYAYVQWDVLVRYLRYLDYTVKWVMNITDVGHLTSDEDIGEDKMEKGAKREGLTVWQIADKYIRQFTDSLDLLGIKRPDVLCRATEHIEEQIGLIKKIEKRGFTYKTKTGLVFDTAKFPDYEKFARLNLKKQNAGSRVEVDIEKRNPWDFLLWVTNQPSHIMKWESPWGKGFPGWHIECTAMSVKYLGSQFDIHTGGIEHIAVHHTNEIAQGFGAFGKMTANYWLHNAWLLLEGEKMSKSLGNNVLVTDLIHKGYSPFHLRYLILNSHYRQGMNFTWKALNSAKNAMQSVNSQILKILNDKIDEKMTDQKIISNSPYVKTFTQALGDDLNIPKALAVFWNTLKANISNNEKYHILGLMDKVLGLGVQDIRKENEEEKIPNEITDLCAQREIFREEKNFTQSDKLRKEIEEKGFYVKDTSKGPQITKINS